MSDADFETGHKVNTREQVRPSMVIMTSKLLGVTEGIATMNLRIAAGVAFCVVLLVATFIVNIIAFDYAKDNEVVAGALVDKSSGQTVMVATQITAVGKEDEKTVISDRFVRGVKNVHIQGQGLNELFVPSTGYAVFSCPTDVPEALQTEYCDADGHAYLVFAGDLVAYYKNGEEGHDFFSSLMDAADASEFLSAGRKALVNEHKSRKLLALRHTVTSPACTCDPINGCTNPQQCGNAGRCTLGHGQLGCYEFSTISSRYSHRVLTFDGDHAHHECNGDHDCGDYEVCQEVSRLFKCVTDPSLQEIGAAEMPVG